MANFNLPLDPAVISSISTSRVVGSSNVVGTLYNSTIVLDPAYIQANLALITAQTAFNFANTIGGGAAIDNVARVSAQSAYVLANTANNLANIAYIQANIATNLAQSAYVQANTSFNAANNYALYTQGVDATQNTQISIIQGVDLTQNTQISIIQGVDLTQNSAITVLQAVNLTQNTSLTNINTFTQSAYNQANTGTTLAQASFNYANTLSGSISGSSVLYATTSGAANALNTNNNYQINSLGVGTTPSGTTGEIRAANEVTAYYSSDERLKENIKTIDAALYKLRKVRGVMFDWKDEVIQKRGGEDRYFVRKHDTGLIAQEIEQVLPEVVAIREDGYKAIRYEKMAGLIIQAINELADQVEELKDKIK